MATLTMQTRHVEATLDTLYAQYGCKYRVVSEKTVFVGKECEENKWIEIVVEPEESVSGG